MDADGVAAAALATKLARALLAEARQGPLLLNVNFPKGSTWPVKATRLGSRVYRDGVEFRRDPRGREYMWIGGPGVEHREIAGSDTEAYDRGEVGVTPLVLDLWSRSSQERAERVVTSFE